MPQLPNQKIVEVEWDLGSLKLDEKRIWGGESVDDVPATWTRVPMAALGRWGSGGTPTRGNKSYYGGKIPWLVIGDLNDGLVIRAENHISEQGLQNSSASIVPKGAVFIAMYGSIGKSGIAGIECATNQAIAHCIPNLEIISTEYLFRLVLAIRAKLFSQGRGLAQQNISQTILKHLLVALPPIGEQQRIVAKVDELMALCDEIEVVQNQRNSIRTAARKSAIDAISAASTSEELNAAWNRISQNWLTISDTLESVSSLRSMILDLAVRGRLLAEHNPTSWDERGFPTNWISESLEAAAEYVQRGKGPKYATKSEVAVVSQKCVKWSGFDISEARFIDASSLSSYKEDRFLRSGDLLWNSTGTGTVGRTALFHEVDDFPKVVADSHVTVIRAPRIMPRFLWIWSASPSIQSEVLGLTTGSTNQQELNLSTIKGLVIAIPPMEEQRRVVDKVDELMELCNQLELSLILRNELIKKISGSLANDATA